MDLLVANPSWSSPTTSGKRWRPRINGRRTRDSAGDMRIEDTGALRESNTAEPNVANRLYAQISDIQAFVASIPDRDTRSPEDIIGYDEAGLPS